MIGARLWQMAGWTMFHYFWIGAVLGAALLLLRWRLRSAAAGVRYAAALGGFFLLCAAPIGIAAWVAQRMPAVEPPMAEKSAVALAAGMGEIGGQKENGLRRIGNGRSEISNLKSEMPVSPTAAGGADARNAAENTWWVSLRSAHPTVFEPIAGWLPWVWVFGAPLTFVLTAAGLLGAERLRRGSRPLKDPRIAEMCRRLATALRISRRVGVAVCDRIAAPILLGVLRPMILLPAAALAGWTPEQLEMALLHELAHVRRWDNLVNLLQRLLESVLFFQPMVWIISGWVRREREHCCDAVVVARTGRPFDYAKMLFALAESVSTSFGRSAVRPPAYSQVVSSFAERPLVGRIRHILNKENPSMRVSSKAFGLVFACVLALAAVVGTYSLSGYAQDSSPPLKSNHKAVEKESAKASEGEKKPAEPLTYTGQVTDKITGKPIAGASVTVRRGILLSSMQRVIDEPKYTTDAAGKYTFTIPPEQVAERFLYIELDVSHADYATRRGFGYALAMIRRNEKLGQRPFFEHVELYPAEPIAGTIVTPDGKPAAGVKVLGFSMPNRRDFDSASFTDVMTDARGTFRLNLSKGSQAILWLLPKDYAPSAHVLDEKRRSDQGRFVLDKGITIKGRLLDEQGKPVAGAWINAEITGGPAKKPTGLPVADFLVRSALTDEKGEFSLAPLPAGECSVAVADYPRDNLLGRQPHHPVPGAFDMKRLTLKTGESTASVEIRGVPHVAIEGQFYNGHGKPTWGHNPSLWGYRPDGNANGNNRNRHDRFYFADGATDKNGHFVIRAPKGLEAAKLDFITNEHSALRVRMAKDGPLGNQHRDIDLGTLEKDIRGIEVIRYKAPILLVKPVTEDGTLLRDAKVDIEYAKGRGIWEGQGRFVEGKDVSFEKQEDGRRRSEQLLPDEEFTLTVTANGFETKSERLKLAEGEVKELEVKLTKKP